MNENDTKSAAVEEQSKFIANGEPEEAPPPLPMRVIIKNLTVLSLAFMFLFTSFLSIQNLQSSLNKEEGLGTISLSVLYVCSMISGLLLPPLVIRHLGCKWTIASSIICYIVYMGANVYAVWGTMIPAAIIIGFGSAPLWTAKCTYLTHIGRSYARLKSITNNEALSILFGVFFACFQSSQIWGNLISSLVFKHGEDIEEYTNTTTSNVSAPHSCGANYCPRDYVNNTKLDRPDMKKIYTLCGIYLGFACLAVLVVAIFLDNLVLDKPSSATTWQLVTAIARHFHKSGYQKLLIPLTVYSGVELAFIYGDFSRSFISCATGVWNVGFVMITFGLADAVFSFIVGRLVKYTGFPIWFLLGFLLHGSCQVTLLIWQPSSDVMVVFYVIAMLWGIGDAIWQTLMNAYYGHFFGDQPESAFASYGMTKAAGFILAFGYSSFLCTNIKIWICLALLVVGICLFAVTEVHNRRTKNKSNLNHEITT